MARNNDDYIKARDPVGNVPVPAEGDAEIRVTEEEELDAALALQRLDWSKGLTRDQIKREYRDLPLGIYLRLPDSKRYSSATEVLHEAGIAPSRAEGDFLGANPDIPAEDSLGDGGPPDWGEQSGVYPIGASLDSGSAEDTEGELPGDNPQLGEEPGQ